MLPAFHRDAIAEATDAMVEEADRALASWRMGEMVDVYRWARELAMRIAMRALLGLDPDAATRARSSAEHFERALSFYGTDYPLRILRGPSSPWRCTQASRKVLDEMLYAEIARRRGRSQARPGDVLSMLVEARDEDGIALSDREIRDHAMTLMFAGHAPRPRRSPSCSTSSRVIPTSSSGSSTRARAGGRLRQLLVVGQPPPARGLPRARGVPARAGSRPSARRGSRRGRMSRSGAARGPASGCASARWR